MKTTTTTKTATKTVAKARQKPAQKPAPMVYKTILLECLAGKFGHLIAGYYSTAIRYHTKQGTSFPRARLIGIPLLADKEAREFIEKHSVSGLPAGSYTGQKIFDAMMIESKVE